MRDAVLGILRGIFAAPKFPDAGKTRRAKLLVAIAWSSAAILLYLIAARLARGIGPLDKASLSLEGLAGVILALIWAIRRGYVRQASILLVLISWSVMVYQAWISDGIRDTAVDGELIIVLICGLLLGWQAIVGLSILSILSLWGMFILETRGILHPVPDDLFGVVRDMTAAFLLSGILMCLVLAEQQRSMDELRSSEERFRKVFYSSPVAICIVSLEEGRFLDANTAFGELYGFDPREAVGKTAIELGTWEGGQPERDAFIRELVRKKSIRNMNYEVTDRSGRKRNTLAFYELIELDGRARVLAMFYDVTEKKMTEQALRESENRLRALLDAVPDTIFELDQDGIFLNFIRSQERDTFVPPGEFVGKTVRQIMPPPISELTLSGIEKALSTGETVNFDYQLTGPLGPRDYEARLAASGPQRVLAIIRDITGRKKIEAEREALIRELELKNAELERFTYTVSHDLKAPLITIKGFAGLLREDAARKNTSRLNKDIQRISDAAEKMQQLLNELLELSRVGRLINPPEAVPFETLISDAVELVRGQLDALKVRVDVRSGMPSVYGDRQRLTEALQNLLDNAAKFMGDQSQPRIEIGQRGHEDGKPIFYIRDNGAGIDPHFHERIFGLFNKLDVDSEGTGVGLALVKRIVEAHGGRIWVESQVGEGAAFFFTLQTGPPA